MKIEYCESCKKRITEIDIEFGKASEIGNVVYCRPCIEKLDIKAPMPNINVGRRGSGLQNEASLGSGIRSREVAMGGGSPSSKPANGIRAKNTGSGIRKGASPGSGIRAGSKPGSGPRKAPNPGSGIRVGANPGSGIRKGASPDSGIRKGANPGSGIRRVVNPGSGVRAGANPGSGIRKGAKPGSGMRHSSGYRKRHRKSTSSNALPSRQRSGLHDMEPGLSVSVEARSRQARRRARMVKNAQKDGGVISVLGILMGLLLGAIVFFALFT